MKIERLVPVMLLLAMAVSALGIYGCAGQRVFGWPAQTPSGPAVSSVVQSR